VGTDITNLLLAFYGNNLIGLPVGPGRAFVMSYNDSILAFTYKETADEYFLTTCLTVNEMSSLREESPVRAFNFHYGETFTKLVARKDSIETVRDYIEIWRRRTPISHEPLKVRAENKKQQKGWPWVAQRIRDIVLIEGHGPGSEIEFMDFIPGPRLMEAYPLEPVPEGEKLRAKFAGKNPAMDAVLAKRQAEKSKALIQWDQPTADSGTQ
jgi:hypothetical protein